MTQQSSTLSIQHIIFTFCSFLIVPILTPLLNMVIHNEVITYTFTLNLAGLLILIRNWNLISLHAQRLKEEKHEAIFFFGIGLLLFTLLFIGNQLYLDAFAPIIKIQLIQSFSLFYLIFFTAFTYIFALIFVVTFKCVTDRLNLKNAEMVVILLSGFLFSLIFTICYIPFNLIEWLKGYLFYFFVTSVISYLYNQTRSIIPGLLSLGTALLIVNMLVLFKIIA